MTTPLESGAVDRTAELLPLDTTEDTGSTVPSTRDDGASAPTDRPHIHTSAAIGGLAARLRVEGAAAGTGALADTSRSDPIPHDGHDHGTTAPSGAAGVAGVLGRLEAVEGEGAAALSGLDQATNVTNIASTIGRDGTITAAEIEALVKEAKDFQTITPPERGVLLSVLRGEYGAVDPTARQALATFLDVPDLGAPTLTARAPFDLPDLLDKHQAFHQVKSGSRVLARGDYGDSIADLQRALTKAGYATGDDGRYGPATAAAISHLQADAGLPATGRLDQATLSALVDKLNPTTTGEVDLTGLDLLDKHRAFHQVKSGSRVLGEGDWGSSIRSLQEALNRIGFRTDIDGRYGAGTTAAIKAVQRANRLEQTGRLDQKTLAAINTAVAALPPRPGDNVVHTTGPLAGFTRDQLRNLFPVDMNSARLSSPFGATDVFRAAGAHSGVDLAARKGTPIRFPEGGKITWYSRNNPSLPKKKRGYGNSIFVMFPDGHGELFAHLNDEAIDKLVGPNAKGRGYLRTPVKVEKGQEIPGGIGATGNVTGPHLHWEVTLGSGYKRVDPLRWLRENRA